MKIATILLAAGASSRMGSPKQLLRYGGRTLLHLAAQRAVASGAGQVYVVLGANAYQLRPELEALDVRALENAGWSEGMGSSIRCGVTAAVSADPALDAVLLLLADQPNITVTSIHRIVAAAETAGTPIAASAYNNILGVPALFRSDVFKALLELRSNGGAKEIIAAYGDQVLAAPMPEAAADIDTPEDYRAFAGSGQQRELEYAG